MGNVLRNLLTAGVNIGHCELTSSLIYITVVCFKNVNVEFPEIFKNLVCHNGNVFLIFV